MPKSDEIKEIITKIDNIVLKLKKKNTILRKSN